MLGIDTNALVRWVARDLRSPEQSDLVTRRLAEASSLVHVNEVVLAETAWALRGKGFGRGDVARVVRRLLDHPRIVVARRTEVEAALAAHESGGAGFADHLISALNAAAGCSTTLTFDKQAAKGPHFTLLT